VPPILQRASALRCQRAVVQQIRSRPRARLQVLRIRQALRRIQLRQPARPIRQVQVLPIQ
jgi:hypothetical protein